VTGGGVPLNLELALNVAGGGEPSRVHLVYDGA